jgi:hypothetical protein
MMPDGSAPAATLDIEIVGGTTQDVEVLLRHLNTSLSSTALINFLSNRVQPYLRHRAEQRFIGEGDGTVGSWAPLAEATQHIRATGPWGVGADHPINVRTHELENYILNGPPSVAEPTSGGAVLKFPGPDNASKSVRRKMKAAQQGKDNPRTPARPILGMDEVDLEFVVTELAFHIQRGDSL